ncbi:MAG: hypothetical protein IT384_11940 [Deltaproteobacteria bacterium]|nr:hypothetical protein [Deltaproteobacteria bacterium]
MTEPHELRCYEYVNRPYAVVRDALRADPQGIFERATKGAAGRAHALAASLKVELGGIEIGTDVTIRITGVEERLPGGEVRTPVTRLKVAWQAVRAPALFPSMEAEVSIYPLSSEETQLDLHGLYHPPLGILGSAVDALVMHRVADASVHRFLAEVASLLRTELPEG